MKPKHEPHEDSRNVEEIVILSEKKDEIRKTLRTALKNGTLQNI